MSDLLSRITIEDGKRGGRPCIRNMRITVGDVLSWHAGGMSESEILADYDELKADDIRASLTDEARARDHDSVPVAA